MIRPHSFAHMQNQTRQGAETFPSCDMQDDMADLSEILSLLTIPAETRWIQETQETQSHEFESLMGQALHSLERRRPDHPCTYVLTLSYLPAPGQMRRAVLREVAAVSHTRRDLN